VEKRKINILINKAGGNASKNALNYKISLPTTWMQQLEVTKENRECELEFDGKKIIITFNKKEN